ncbi:amino acid adenylation domain-containing protein, partial [Chryseobacterium gambrini]
MGDNQFLSNNFWSKKIRYKDRAVFSKKEINNLKIEISKNDLKDFIKISKNNHLSKFTIISSIFSFLIKKYFSSFQNIVKIYPSNLLNLEKLVLLEIKDNDIVTFKELLQSTANEIKETFSYKDYNSTELELDSFSNYSIKFGSEVHDVNDIKDNVSLLYEETDDKIILSIYHQETNQEYLLESLLNNFEDILSDYESFLNREINSYSLTDSKAREQILLNFNATEVTYPSDKNVLDLLESQVISRRNYTAVVYKDRELSYEELNELSNQLGHYLIDNYNIHGDDLICIKLPRSEKVIIAILGILKSGGAYVPIDPEYPNERIDYLLKDTGCKVLIDESFLSEFENQRKNYSIKNPEITIQLDHLAYVIYTSGTTGNPKGVMIEHRNLFHSTINRINFYSIESMLLVPSFSFDSSVAVIFGVLCSGGRLLLEDNNKIKDLEYISNQIIKYNIDGVLCVPNYYSNLIPYLNENGAGKNNLKHIIVAGEELVKNLVLDHQKHSKATLYNEYGPTECAVWSSVSVVENTNVNIGRSIPNTEIYILDENRHLLPIGVAGELYISGAGLARGYLNLPDLSSEKFVANPFVDGRKMYRTGDLGRWLPDGNIEYLGRIDHQVKIRGHRIELGEIENQVFSYNTSIKFTIADVKEHEGEKSLVVYYVSDTIIDKQKLSEYLESKLPQYMLPSFYVALESMPLTSNGKIDRKMLPEVSSIDLIKTEYIAPRSSEEHALVSVFEQVLKYNPISIRDNYYNLGGDSIKSIQIVSRLRQLGYNLKVEHILRYPVLEELARYITIDVSEINQSAVTGDSVLTPIQRYFFGNENIVNKNHYNQAVILKSSERLSYSVLESSIQSLVNHHDALRMLYREENGKWSQYNSGTEGNHYHFEYFDVREEGSLEAELASLEKIGEHLQSNIDIESGILFHIGHVSMSDMDRIILVIHHLVVDGVSWRILLEDLGNLYDSGIKGVSYELPSKTDSFQSWGTTLEAYSKSPILSKEYLYWDSIESDVYPAIATDYTLNGKHILDTSINFSLNEESTKLLQTHVGKEYSAEINDVLLTGLALSLQEEFGINKTKILMEGHGREAMSTGLDISRTVGWFTTLYPFSLDISNNNQPALVSVKDGLRGIPNKGIGYGILNYLGDSFSSTNNPSIQFNYLGDFDDAIGHQFYYSSESIGISVSEENLGTDILLDVSGITISGKMNLTIRYSSSVFHAATVQKLMDNYQSHLEKMIHKEKESEVILTPSDLTYKELPFNTIQEINKSFDIEDIYELSPMQQGLYYHWMAAPKGSAYFMQTSYRSKFEGFEVLEVERAFGILVNRYTVLRTSFDNRFGEVPLQIVHKKAQVDFEYLTIASEDSLEIDLESIKQNDITRGFDLSKPTQMRLIIVKLPNDTYEFIWSYHHIVMDGWCLSILINDFSAILDSVKQGLEINLPEPQKYSAYLKWLGGIDKDSSMLHWKNYLEGISAPTLIPFEKRTKDELPHFVTEKFNVTGDEFKEISQLCQNLGVTLNTYIQAIWSYLLSKYNSSEEIIFGAVVSGRPAEIDNIEHMVGLFINTIPVRISVKNDDTPYSLLKKVHQDSIQNTEYHFNSLAEVQSLSPLGKDLLSNIIIFENYVKQDVSNTSNLGLIDENVDTFEQTNYDFNIVVVPGRNNLSVYFKYNASVFYESLVKSLVSHFKHLLGQFVACPDQQINNFSYLSTSEVKELLDDFNETEISYPSEETIVSLFESQVANTPDNIAVVFGDINLSYQELNKQSNQLAHYLSEKYDIKCDDLICIQLPRSEKMIISILGVLKSGGAYVPIDNDYPQNRIDYIVEDTKSKVIIDEKFWLEFNLLKDDYSVDKQDVAVKSSDLAYVIYTSGTTGNPKGVMIEHKNVVRLFFNDNALYDFNSNDSWTLFHSYNFDFSVWECYGALLFGGCLHVIPKRVAQDVGMFLNYLITNKITILNQTPAAFYNLAGYDRAFNHQELALRYIIFGGEALNPYLLKDWQSKYPDIKLINMYGITETTVHVTYKELSVKDTNSVLSNIGKPIPTLNCYILDENRHLLPIGVAGELYISGAGLARGYLNLPDLSSEKFVANPFVDGRKMYRTGDLGRWLPDGNIEYLGRIDHQVKIRGHRIELGEIENQVFSYNTSIKFTIADVKEHEGEKSLVVYYVSDTIIDKQKLSEYLESKLPQYMLPSFYVALESMPLTSNGKIDRKMLPEVSSIDLIKTEYIAPRSSEEHALVSVFEQVLKYNPISIRDNYYNLGGDSIKSIQIVSRLRQLGYNLKVEHILRYPVLEELARYITIDVSEINQSAVTGDSVLTPIQRYFFGNENIVNKNHYNQAVILKSSERLSYSVLESSIQSLVNHHDALRMLYREENGKWSQYNSGTEGNHYHFEYFDVREEGSLEAELASLEKIGEHLQSNIDIESGILFHIGHVSMSDMDRIILVIHHLVVDGVSWRILLEDLGNLYDSGIKGVSYELPSKTDSFQSWGTTLEAYSKSPILSKEYLYWDSIESDVYPAIATDYTLNGKHILDTSINFSLNEESTKLLQTHVGKEYSAEINDVLLTGLALSLQEEFGINKTKILMEGHGREAMSTGLDISRTVGWFTTLYPFSLDISNNNQPALVSVKDGLRGIPNKGIGYGILNYLGDSFSSTNNPSIQFNYLGDFDDAIGHQFYYSSESIGISVSEENLGTDILLDVSGITISGKMNLTIRYSSSVFHAATVQKLMDNYQSHLEKMIHKEKESEVILTPSDLTYKELPFNTIQEINKSFDIEDIYELSPMQQGLYYHWMAAPKGSAYFMQTSYRSKFEGFEVLEVERAFGILVNRYTVLRTSFDNRFGEVPLQIVHKKAQVDFEYLTIASEDSLEIDLESIKQNDITRGFDLSKPTQMRLIIVKLPNDTYEFIWSYHHIVMDGWCLSILINDFSAILDSVKQGLEINLPEPQKYSAYLKWLGGIDKDSSMLHWKNYLEGISAPTLIPFEKRTKDELPHFVTEKFNVTGDEFKEISQLCQNLGVTLNTYIQAIWSYLLSKYNSSEEIIFGAVVSGRPAEIDNIEHMVGLFINTIPVRISVKNDDTPYSLLKKVHQDSIQNTEYHFNSLAEVQSLSPLGKDLLSNIIIFENYVKNEPNENFENIKVFDQSNYNFTLVVEPYEDYLHIDFEYNASVYSSYIKVLVSHFKNTLNQFKTHINTPLSEIDYLTFEAREELLKHFNSTLVLYPEDKTIVSLFEDQISLTPDSTAVVFEDIRLSYAELNAKASCLAHQLKDTYGIKKGDQVGVMLNRGENQIISILGILKLGAIYVPIDANLPKSRKEVMTSGLSLLITESYYFFDLDFYSGNSFSIDLEFTDEDASDFKSEVLGKDDIAYIIYTSGSTGEPKGVLNTHRGILNTMLFQKDFFEVPSCENVAQFASFSFDASISEIFMTLLCGKSLHILSDSVRKDAYAFEEYVEKHSIDLVTLPPAFFSLLNVNKLQKLKGLITAGESAVIVKTKEYLKYGTFYNAYGPTETSICATVYKIEKGSELKSSAIPIGKPIANTQIYILDSHGHLVPIGVVGELYISGSGLARGYLNLEELTEDK